MGKSWNRQSLRWGTKKNLIGSANIELLPLSPPLLVRTRVTLLFIAAVDGVLIPMTQQHQSMISSRPRTRAATEPSVADCPCFGKDEQICEHRRLEYIHISTERKRRRKGPGVKDRRKADSAGIYWVAGRRATWLIARFPGKTIVKPY